MVRYRDGAVNGEARKARPVTGALLTGRDVGPADLLLGFSAFLGPRFDSSLAGCR